MKLKKGDTVQIVAGKDKGQRGEVLRVSPKDNRVVVQGLNIRKKHQRARQNPNMARQMAPEILQFEGPMDASNVQLVCPKCGELTRVGYQRDAEGVTRLCRKCKAEIDG
jgi:large subunit ribosomal protein L24